MFLNARTARFDPVIFETSNLRNQEGIVAKHFQVLIILALAPSLAIAQLGSGNTTLPVGNFGARSILPTGQIITPLAAPSSTIQPLSTGLRADGDADGAEAVNTALSPDGRSLLVLTS